METKDNVDQVTHTDIGVIKIADEVVAIVASLAATEVKGVAV